MTPETKKPKYFKLKDKDGNEFICPLKALKHIKDATAEELDECVEADVIGRYAGDINVIS